MLSAMIAGKYYEKNLQDSVDLCVNAKALKDLGMVLMPFNTEKVEIQTEMDAD